MYPHIDAIDPVISEAWFQQWTEEETIGTDRLTASQVARYVELQQIFSDDSYGRVAQAMGFGDFYFDQTPLSETRGHDV